MTYEFTYRKFAAALYDALREDAFYQAMERSVDNGSGKAAMRRYMDYSMVEAARYGFLFISDVHDHGCSVWARPLDAALAAEKHHRKRAFLESHMGPASVTTYDTICDFMTSMARPLIAEDAWYLSILGILPEFQGRGLGAGLVEGGLVETDRLGASTYLETFTPRNRSFYERLGYRSLQTFHEPTTDAQYTLMVREPAPES